MIIIGRPYCFTDSERSITPIASFGCMDVISKIHAHRQGISLHEDMVFRSNHEVDIYDSWQKLNKMVYAKV